MSSFLSSRRVLTALSLLAVLLAPACTTAPQNAAPPLPTLTYAGSQQAVENLDREIAAAGQDSVQLSAIAARLIHVLRAPDTTPAARQAIGQRLAVFPAPVLLSNDNRTLFTAMFADEKQLNYARLALDLVPGAEIDALYLQALAASTPHTRLAFIQSIGNRRITSAVPPLAALLNNSDPAVVAAAVKALGQIGTESTLAALATAATPFSPRVVEARLTAAHHLGGAVAIREFQILSTHDGIPGHLRAAAVRELLFAEPDRAPARFIATLAGNDTVLKPVVIEAIASHPAGNLVSALSSQLSAWDAPTQAAVIAALSARRDAAAVPAVSAATGHPDAAVRTAAITALGRLPGNPDTALLLAQLATADRFDEAKLAKLSLSQLTGPGVADTVITGATGGDQAVRVVFLEQIASRNMTASLPLLLATRQDPVPAVRSAALGSLAEIAGPTEQRALLDWAIAASDATEQSRALRALASVTLRDSDAVNRARPITQAIEQAPTALALRLLPVLPRIGGLTSAECTARLALRDDAGISAAAINTLTRWPDGAGLLPLVEVAAKVSTDTARTAAMQGVVRYLERSRAVTSADLTAIVSRLVPLCRDTDIQQRLVYLLGRSSETDALELATKLEQQPALAAVAADAAAIIRSHRAGPPLVRASGNERQVKNIADGKLNTRWSVPARPDQWIEVDFKRERPFRQIVLDNNGETWGFPEQYAVFVTDNPKEPGQARVTGSGQAGKTTIDLPAGTRGRYLIIRHTADVEDSVWAISELIVD